MSSKKTKSATRTSFLSWGQKAAAPVRLKPAKSGLESGRKGPSAQFLLPLLITALLVSLGIAALRIDLLRVRYALAAATLEEQRLLDESRALTAEMRRLRDPYHLALQAQELGFVRPARLIEIREAHSSEAPLPERVAAHQPNAAPSLP